MHALERVGIADRQDHFPRQLSGGQEQRVAIARAIVTDPAILVADEPTGDLDKPSAHAVMSLLREFNRDLGKTIIMVTHDPKTTAYATRTLHLDKGQLVEGGAASAIEASNPGNALINESDHVISGTGLVGALTDLGVVNHGVIRSEGDAPGSLDLEPGLNADVFLTFDIVNSPTGVIETFGDARNLTIRNADIRNEGEIRSRSGNGSQVSLDGVYIDNHGGLVSDVVIRGGAWLSGGSAAGNSRVQGLGGVIEDLELRGVLVSQVPVRMRGEITTTLLSAKLDIVGGALVDPETGATFSGTTGGFHIRGAVANTNPTLPAQLTISEGAFVRGDGGQIGQELSGSDRGCKAERSIALCRKLHGIGPVRVGQILRPSDRRHQPAEIGKGRNRGHAGQARRQDRRPDQ